MLARVKLGETIRLMFGTANTTGAAANADSTPTATVYDQGVAMGYAPTVTNKATGSYEVAIVASTGNGFVVGHEYAVSVAATVSGITGRDGLESFIVETSNITDLAKQIAILMGLHRRNSLLDGGAGFANVQRNADKVMTSARLRVFASAAARAAATPGALDGADGETHRYTITGTETGSTGLFGTMALDAILEP